MLGWSALVLAALTAGAPSTGLDGVRFAAPTPDFTIPLQHRDEDLYALRGRVVVINFWATWCGPCTAEMKYFERAQATYGKRVSVVTVSNEPHDVAASYFRLWNIDLPVVEDLSGAIWRLYSIGKIPVTLVLDASGNVTYVSLGELDWGELQGAIDRALGEPAGGTRLSPSTPSPRVLH